jgi:hypothetical protein
MSERNEEGTGMLTHTRKWLLPAIAAATALLATFPMGTASAASLHVLTINKVGGPNVAVGAILKAGLKTGTKATFFTPGTKIGVTCSRAQLTNKVTKNPPKPGTAGESLSAQTFTTCTTNIPGATGVRSIAILGLPYAVTVSDSKGFPLTVTKPRGVLKTMITINTVIGTITCTYSAVKIAGNASNVGSLNIYKNQVFTKSAGPAVCLPRGSFSATFGPVVDSSVKGSPHVFVN